MCARACVLFWVDYNILLISDNYSCLSRFPLSGRYFPRIQGWSLQRQFYTPPPPLSSSSSGPSITLEGSLGWCCSTLESVMPAILAQQLLKLLGSFLFLFFFSFICLLLHSFTFFSIGIQTDVFMAAPWICLLLV